MFVSSGFFESWSYAIVIVFWVLLAICIFVGFLSTKTGKKAENVYFSILHPIAKWYRNLADKIRSIVGVSTFTLYFICSIVLLIFIFEG